MRYDATSAFPGTMNRNAFNSVIWLTAAPQFEPIRPDRFNDCFICFSFVFGLNRLSVLISSFNANSILHLQTNRYLKNSRVRIVKRVEKFEDNSLLAVAIKEAAGVACAFSSHRKINNNPTRQ